jgi:hypothetical protein
MFFLKQRLTGGELLARDKYYITLYRGKDFLPEQVASALKERLKRLSTGKVGEDVLRDHKGTGIQTNKSAALGEQQETENLFSTERKAVDSDRVLLMHTLEEKLATVIGDKSYSMIINAEFSCELYLFSLMHYMGELPGNEKERGSPERAEKL